MRFKVWLCEARYNDMVSWLSPTGKFYPVECTTHTDDAIKHVSAKNAAEAKDTLLKNGWMRVTYLNKNLYANNPHVAPNSSQKRELVDLALMRDNITHVIYDNDEDEKVIYSKLDLM